MGIEPAFSAWEAKNLLKTGYAGPRPGGSQDDEQDQDLESDGESVEVGV
jgi:hypothetical protein